MYYVKTKFLRVFGMVAFLLAAFSFSPNSFGIEKEVKLDCASKYGSVQTNWMKHVNSYLGENKSGTLLRQGPVHPEFSRDEGHEFEAMDKHGKPVIFEWEKVLVKQEAFVQNMCEIADIRVVEFVQEIFNEMKELSPKQLSEAIEGMSKEFEEEFQELIKNGAIKKNIEKGVFEIVDWDLTKKIYIERFKLEFKNFENYLYDSEDIFVFVKLKNQKTRELIGYAIFLIGNESPEGFVRLVDTAVESKWQSYGLEKLLVSSVFNILPNIKQIFHDAFVSDKKEIKEYNAWGFVIRPEVAGEVSRSITMDYFVDKENKLQDVAKSLKLVK